MDKSIKVSIIMPVYNSGKYLQLAVESILSQDFSDFELIIVDDGSTDGSSEKCDEYAQKDHRVKIIHQTNKGLCDARNAAMKIATGEYIAFCDHDDVYLHGLLTDNYKLAKTYSLDFVKFCKRWDTIKDNQLIYSTTNHFPDSILDRNGIKNKIIELNKLDYLSCVWDGLYKRSFLIDNCIVFDTFFKFGGEDYDFIYRCLINANKIGVNSKVYYHHYTRLSFSTSSKFDPNKIDVVKKRFELFKTMVDAYSIDMANYKEEYVRFFIKDFVVPIIIQLNRGQKSLHEKSAIFKDCIRKIDFEYDFIRTYQLSFFKFKHLSAVQQLYKHKCYKGIFILYMVKDRILKLFL